VGKTKLNHKFPCSLVLVAVSSSCGLVFGLVPSSCCPVLSSLTLSGCLVVLGEGGSSELTDKADKGNGIVVSLVLLSCRLAVEVISSNHHPILPLYHPSPLPFRPSGRLLFCGKNKAQKNSLVVWSSLLSRHLAVVPLSRHPVVLSSCHLVVDIILSSRCAGRRGTAWNSRPTVAMGASGAVSPD
jgi:hypothetical protein